MVKILSIDQSLTNTGYTIFSNNRFVRCGSFSTKIVNVKCNVCQIERLYEIKQQLNDLIDEFEGFDYCIMESYSYGSNSRSFFQLGELGGVIKMLMYENNIKLVTITPSVAKKYLDMKKEFKQGKESGMSNKEITFTAIKEKFQKLDFNNDDEADSFLFGVILKEYLKYIKKDDVTNYSITHKEVFTQVSMQLQQDNTCKQNHYKEVDYKTQSI